MNASFVYDGLGRREKKTINGTLTEFLYDGLNPVQETSGAAILANILPGLGIDEFLTRTDVVAGVTSSFLTDALGSPVAATDNNGAVQTEYSYEPFGKTTLTGATNSSSYQYTGRENDGTGLYYYRARYYHPGLQRFISEDPVNVTSTVLNRQDSIEFDGLRDLIQREPQRINEYSYVVNNPVIYNDPRGEIAPGIIYWGARLALGGILYELGYQMWQALHGHIHGGEPHIPHQEPALLPGPKDQDPSPGGKVPDPKDPPPGGPKPPQPPPKRPPNYSPGRGGGGARR